MMNFIKYLRNPYRLAIPLSLKGWFKNMDDEKYLKIMFRSFNGKKLNLDNPILFNEKIQWLKLHSRDPLFTMQVDKYSVKKYISDTLGKEYVVKLYGVWEKFEEINFDNLPDSFVLKVTHDSGGLVICQDKSTFDKDSAREIINKALNHDYYLWSREWPYKNVKRRIIAEEYLENGSEGLHDYKIWCFNGKPVYTQYITGRINGQTYEGFYDQNWVLQDFCYHNPLMQEPIERPKQIDIVLKAAEKLAAGTAFARCDFYILNDGQIKFGECTFYPMSGFETWKPEKMDRILGDMIDLSIVNKQS